MSDTVALIQEHGLIAVVSAPVEDRLVEWALAVSKGGIKLLGIPVTYPQVTEVTSELADEANLCVGLSGVVSPDQIPIALAAGADFVLSPICDPEIIRSAQERGLAVIAGAATPSEIARCIAARPDLVMVFPSAELGGPSYFRRIVPLFPTMPLVAAGGVDVEAAPGYLEAGAVAAIVDTGVFPATEDPAAAEVITTRAAALSEVCGEVMGLSARVSMADVLSKPPPPLER